MPLRPLIPCLLAPALLAQAPADPAVARMAEMRMDQDPASPHFLWIHPKDQRFQGGWELDPAYSQVASDQEIAVSDFHPGEAEAWAARLAWAPGDHWLLLSPEGEPLLSGMAPPKAADLLDAMRSYGWTPRADRLSRFLREHPDNGDAWVEALLDAAAYASRRAVVERRLSGGPLLERKDLEQAPPLSPEQDEARWAPAREALEGFLRVDGWATHWKLPEIVVRLDVGGVRGSLLMQDPLQRLRRGIEEALRRDPGSRHLWFVWSNLLDPTPGGDTEGLLKDLDPLPRAPWPPIDAADPLGRSLAKAERWPELEALATRAYTQGLDPALSPYLSGPARLALVQRWGFWRVLALLRMDRRDDAAGVIKELRAECGSEWPDFGGRWLGASLAYYLGPDDPILSELKAAKDGPSPPDPPKPAVPLPLRLVLVGHPGWENAWQRYPGLSAFDPWEPEQELSWKALQPAEEAALRARLGWGQESRWALLRGPEVLASGTSLPSPSVLADRLRSEGKPYLEQLNGFIRAHPDRLDARRARLEELRGRMPNERLEAPLLEDARLSLLPFAPGRGTPFRETGDWTPRKQLWSPAAPKALVALEARLRHWPGRRDLWQAWFDWNAVMEHPSSPVVVLDGLPIWRTRFDRGAGPLSSIILTLGSSELNAQGRWKELADWCARFWEGGARDALRRLAAAGGGAEGRPPELVWNGREELREGLLVPYRTALEKLGRTGQLRAFLQELNDLDPSLADSLTASSTPPRPGR
ncbi:MAG TPA: hypothetical protein VFT46_05440 [Holophagaceae bacterium]|nr:hypothetical protein [Holophagaceae bacterium]